MRYNENDGEEINEKIVITTEIDDNPIFEISCVVAGNISAETIKANYDLVIVGNVEAEKIEVAGDFTCIGNCNCDDISIQGACTLDGNLTVDNGFVGDSLVVKELCAENLEIKGTVSCTNMECNEDVICDKYVLIAEGLMGSGTLSSKMTICGEYSLLEETSGVFIADTLEMEKPKIVGTTKASSTIDLEEWKTKAKTLSSQRFLSELTKLADQQERYKGECNAFRKLMLVENITMAPSIKAYVDIMDTVNRKYSLISNTKLYGKVKARFESFDYSDISHSKMPKLSQRDFAKMLHTLLFKPQLFSTDIRELIIETIYTYVGMDYEKFQDEYESIEQVEKESQEIDVKHNAKRDISSEVQVGDLIKVIDGVWQDTLGKISAVNEIKQVVTINIDLFGRKTPIEIAFGQFKKYSSPINVNVGDEIVVCDGSWKDIEGKIVRIDEVKQVVTINIELFGRDTPVEVRITDVKKK